MTLIPGLEAHSSGALWLAATRTAFIADLHLGYGWAQRRRGELGPLADANSREKLRRMCGRLRPEQIVFLGDLVHAPRPGPAERAWIEETLTEVAACAKLIAVRGNHDRAFAYEFGHLPVQTVESWSGDHITAIHGDRLAVAVPEHHTLVLGHLHPAFTVREASGAGYRLPLFLASRRSVLMPAFSPFAGGYDVGRGLPVEFASLFGREEPTACVVSGNRAVALGPLGRALAVLGALEANAPEAFQGRRRRRGPGLSPRPAAG